MSRILLIDNFDSFTYNLYHYLCELSNKEVDVIRNTELSKQIIGKYDEIVISPGPGLPKDAGALEELLPFIIQDKKVLGICLGLQALAEHYGMRLKNLNQVIHGQKRRIEVSEPEDILFKNLPLKFNVGRYHSWVVDTSITNTNFRITSVDEENNVMSMTHKSLPIYAVQFHPESILTSNGKQILSNWLEY